MVLGGVDGDVVGGVVVGRVVWIRGRDLDADVKSGLADGDVEGIDAVHAGA